MIANARTKRWERISVIFTTNSDIVKTNYRRGIVSMLLLLTMIGSLWERDSLTKGFVIGAKRAT